MSSITNSSASIGVHVGIFTACLRRILQTVEDSPVIPDSLGGQLTYVLHHRKVRLAARTLRYQIPLQVGGIRIRTLHANQTENNKKAKDREREASEQRAHAGGRNGRGDTAVFTFHSRAARSMTV